MFFQSLKEPPAACPSTVCKDAAEAHAVLLGHDHPDVVRMSHAMRTARLKLDALDFMHVHGRQVVIACSWVPMGHAICLQLNRVHAAAADAV